MSNTAGKLIHVASYYGPGGRQFLLLLREVNGLYRWFVESQQENEEPTDLEAGRVHEAIRLAARHYRHDDFVSLHCGYRYDSEDRDEHGINALFHEMVASYSNASIDGAYQNSDLSHQFFVKFAPDQALTLWKRLESEKRL